MLAGAPPFSGRTVQATIARHRQDPIPSLRVVRPGAPPHVEAAVEKAMAKVRADRFTTAAEFAEALEAAPVPEATLRPAVQRWSRPGSLGALGVLALVLALLLWWLPRRAPAGPSADPALIIVADFLGPPGDRTLATAVRQLVVAELDQSRVVAPMPRPLIAAAMASAGLPDTTSLSEDRARELAVRSSVRTVLTGSVLPVGEDRFSIILRVTDADSGRTLFSVAKAPFGRDLIPAVQSAAHSIRLALGERGNAIAANKPLVQVATPSFPAYRKYAEAVALTERGDAPGSNRLLQDALALDTGFAAAWATMATNYQTMRKLDSAGLAIGEALRRPTRLSDAQQYRLQADAAYMVRYDIPAAIRWYDLLLQIAPRSISGHNNRAVLLYTLGRYDEALAGFRRTEALEPFGDAQAQIEIFNQMATLLALGRESDAMSTARGLREPFANWAAQLLATYAGRWSVAESLAAVPVRDPSTPSWLKLPATTMLAGAHAARGATELADRELRDAATITDPSAQHWFSNALVLLAAASRRSPGPMSPSLRADTSGGGLVAGGLWAALRGDTVEARRRLEILMRRPQAQLRRLGSGPLLLGGYLLAAEGRWNEVARQLGAAAMTGELDGGDLDQVSGLAVRWLTAEAYERLGKPDLAATMYEKVLDPRHLPFSHLALRGLVHPFASRRLALLGGPMNTRDTAPAH